MSTVKIGKRYVRSRMTEKERNRLVRKVRKPLSQQWQDSDKQLGKHNLGVKLWGEGTYIAVPKQVE